jgi:hypothetical protein
VWNLSGPVYGRLEVGWGSGGTGKAVGYDGIPGASDTTGRGWAGAGGGGWPRPVGGTEEAGYRKGEKVGKAGKVARPVGLGLRPGGGGGVESVGAGGWPLGGGGPVGAAWWANGAGSGWNGYPKTPVGKGCGAVGAGFRPATEADVTG